MMMKSTVMYYYHPTCIIIIYTRSSGAAAAAPRLVLSFISTKLGGAVVLCLPFVFFFWWPKKWHQLGNPRRRVAFFRCPVGPSPRRGGVFSGREVRGSVTAAYSAAICNPILPSPQLAPVTSEWVRKGPITFVPMPACAAPAGAAQDQFCGNYFFKKGRNFFSKKTPIFCVFLTSFSRRK